MPLMRKKPDLPHIDPASLTAPPVSNPPDAAAAAQEALTRAAEAAARGHLGRADRESRLAERLERLARNAAESAEAEEAEPDEDGEVFRRDLQRRIDRDRLEQRKEQDELKARDPVAWQRAYEAARAEALEKVEAFWLGDPRLFEEPEGGYPEYKG
jgi:hypothetical protein